MARALILLFSITSYGFFLLVLLYLLAFLANAQATPLALAFPVLESLVPYSVDAGRQPAALVPALAIDLVLIALFGIQHSMMARQGFKRVWTKVIPKEAERSFYVLMSSLVLAFIMWQWQPVPAPALWQAEAAWTAAAGYGVLGLGVVILLWSTFLIDHFDLFGLKQAWCRFRDRPIRNPRFMTPLLYRFVRHPLYVGWFLIFWGTPSMTMGHLLFALGMSSYIFIAIRYEERDLVSFHGDAYRRYQQQVPMLVPMPGKRLDG